VDVVVPLGGVLGRGPRLADEVGADLGLISAEEGQAVTASGDRVGGAPCEGPGLGDVALGLGQRLPPGVGGEVDVQLGDGELDVGDRLALGCGILVAGPLRDAVGIGLLALVDGQ